MQLIEISLEMRLFSPDGERFYLTAQERERFLAAAVHEDRVERLYCEVLHYTGCRPSEALELHAGRVHIDEGALLFRSLKKRKVDAKGRQKQPHYRSVPVPRAMIEKLDYLFDIRTLQWRKKAAEERLFDMSRATAYRLIKRVMARAGIEGKQATGKGLRHGYCVKMVTAKKPLPIHVLSQPMSHTDTKTTEVYLQILGDEKRQLVTDAWAE